MICAYCHGPSTIGHVCIDCERAAQALRLEHRNGLYSRFDEALAVEATVAEYYAQWFFAAHSAPVYPVSPRPIVAPCEAPLADSHGTGPHKEIAR